MGKIKLFNIRLITSLIIATLCTAVSAIDLPLDEQITVINNDLNHDVSVAKFNAVGRFLASFYNDNGVQLGSGDRIIIPARTSLTLNFKGVADTYDRYGTMILNPSSSGNDYSSVYYVYTGYSVSPDANYRFIISNIYNVDSSQGNVGDMLSSDRVAKQWNRDPNTLYYASAKGNNEISLTEHVCANQPTIGKYLNCLKD